MDTDDAALEREAAALADDPEDVLEVAAVRELMDELAVPDDQPIDSRP